MVKTIQNIEFNIAGAFSKFDNLALFFTLNKEVLEKYDITVYDGINLCHWNGGRINTEIFFKPEQVQYYYNKNISIALTFTNNKINLNDKTGNYLLNYFHRENNKIILVNEDLRKYIRDNYPKYKIVHSITDTGKLSVEYNECIDYYKDLETKYDFIVPKMEHVMFLDNKLDLSKYEIMLNDSCIYNCPLYNEHFEKINEQNLLNNPVKELSDEEREKISECWIPTFNPDLGDKKYKEKFGLDCGMDLNIEQVKILIKRGIKRFKISGREMNNKMFNSQLDIFKYLDN